jgi:hypothetical protein
MNFKAKRYCKKMARIYFSLAWAVTIIWIFSLIGSFIIIAVNQPSNIPIRGDFFVFLFLLFPLFLGLILGFIGQDYANMRIKYKKQINQYRQRRFFTQIIDLLRRGNIIDAVIMYNKLLKDDTFRHFIFPLIISESIHSSDDNRKKIGTDKLYDILEEYNPEKIIF